MSGKQEKSADNSFEFKELLRRTEATQRLQGRDRLRSCRVAADAGRESDFSILRNSELGRASCGVAARYRISRGGDSGMGIRAYAGRIEANGVRGRIADKSTAKSRLDLCRYRSRRDLGESVFLRALHRDQQAKRIN